MSERQKKKPRGRPFQRGSDPRRKNDDGTQLPQRRAGNPCPRCEYDRATKHDEPARFGILTPKMGQFGRFIGCNAYPACTYTQRREATHEEMQADRDNGTAHAAPVTPQALPLNLNTMTTPPAIEPAHTDTEEQQPMTAPAPVGSLDAMVAALARAAAAESVNETRVNEIVSDALERHSDVISSNVSRLIESALAERPAGSAQTFTVRVNDAPALQIEGTAHAALREVLTLAVAGFNIYLVGPAGSGKTTLGEQVAAALGRPFASISCAPGLPESALLGRMIPNLSDGSEHYRPVPFVEAYRSGWVFLADEIDNADASTLLVLNSGLSNGHITLPSGERIERHPDFVFIVSANTFGHGQTREYVGRTQLDAAFLDRFIGSTVEIDYDRALETAICPDIELNEAVWRMRDRARSLKLRRVVSTRAIVHGHKLRARCGYTLAQTLERLTRGWPAEDRTAVGVN